MNNTEPIFQQIMHRKGVGSVNMPDYKDTLITGQMVTVSLVVSNYKFENSHLNANDFKKVIKMELCRMMSQKMYEQNLFSFTVSEDIPTDSKTFFARMFVTPNEQTQMIRQILANK